MQILASRIILMFLQNTDAYKFLTYPMDISVFIKSRYV